MWTYTTGRAARKQGPCGYLAVILLSEFALCKFECCSKSELTPKIVNEDGSPA
jgi:hypothetical protein